MPIKGNKSSKFLFFSFIQYIKIIFFSCSIFSSLVVFAGIFLQCNTSKTNIEQAIQIKGIDDQASYNKNIDITINITDAILRYDTISVLINDQIVYREELLVIKKYTYQKYITLKIETYKDGQYVFKVILTFRNKIIFENNKVFYIDRNPPVLKILNAVNHFRQGNTYQLQVKSNENLDYFYCEFYNRKIKFYQQSEYVYCAFLSVPVKAKPNAFSIHLTAEDVAGNITKFESEIIVHKKEFKTEHLWIPQKKKHLLTDKNLANIMAKRLKRAFAHEEDRQMWQGIFMRPVEGPVSSPFGKKRIYNKGVKYSVHYGLDIVNKEGTPVRSCARGVITLAEEIPICGKTVIIHHGQKVFSIYQHLSEIKVVTGQVVEKYLIIGHLGSTGQSTGPHLHWGMQVSGIYVNPEQWLKTLF